MTRPIIKKKFRLYLNYLGHTFYGFQSQADGNTIQDHLEKALSIYLREKIKITGASRTDSGVHAREQICTFESCAIFDPNLLVIGVIALMPNGIGIHRMDEVPLDFHPIRNAKAKLYKYRIWTAISDQVLESNQSWKLNKSLNQDIIDSEGQKIVGTHDFQSFCAIDSSAKTYTRTIFDYKTVSNEFYTDIYFLGEGFLKQMIRILVGSLVEKSLLPHIKPSLSEILEKKDRQFAGMTAPANGLTLEKVYFDQVPNPLKVP